MKQLLDWNESVLAALPPESALNRALHYGDGVFETFLIFKNTPLNWDFHITRLHRGLAAIGAEIPPNLHFEGLKTRIQKIAVANEAGSLARGKVIVYRENGNGYAPEGDRVSSIVTVKQMDGKEPFPLKKDGFSYGLFPHGCKYPDFLANHKTLSALPYVLAARFGKSRGWEETILLNHEEKALEGSRSNLFLIEGKRLITPPLSDGPVAGTARDWLLTENPFEVEIVEETVEQERLLLADGVLFTNAIQGIQFGAEKKSAKELYPIVKEWSDAYRQKAVARSLALIGE